VSKKSAWASGVAQALEAAGEGARVGVDPPGDGGEPLGPVVDGVEPGDVGEEHLRRADVGGRLLAADVLLAGLERHPEGGVALRVHAEPDDPAGDLPLELVGGGEERGVRAAVPHRHAEPLGVADGAVRPELARRAEEGQRQQVGRDGDVGARGVGGLAEPGVVAHGAVRGRVLEERAERGVVEVELGGVGDDDLHAERLGAALDHRDRLRVAVGGDEEPRALARLPEEHAHRLGRGRPLVEQRGVGDGEPGEVGDGGLEVQEGLEPALRDLGLVGGVGGVPAGVLEDVPEDDRRRERSVVAHPDVRAVDVVPLGEGAGLRQQLVLGQGGGRASGRSVRMASGRRARRASSRLPSPSASSISRTSSWEGPLWRRSKRSGWRRATAGASCIGGRGSGVLLAEGARQRGGSGGAADGLGVAEALEGGLGGLLLGALLRGGVAPAERLAPDEDVDGEPAVVARALLGDDLVDRLAAALGLGVLEEEALEVAPLLGELGEVQVPVEHAEDEPRAGSNPRSR
jgi:hypothetical protein